MNKLIKKLLFILILIGFTNCSTSQKIDLQEKTSFNISSVFAQAWTAGQKDGGSGINVQMTIQNLNKNIVLKDFYFRGRKTRLEDISTNNNGLYIARYINAGEKEIVLHENQKKEAQNQPPNLKSDVPFILENDEGVLSYTENETLKHYKIKNIAEKFPIQYPSAPENKQ